MAKRLPFEYKIPYKAEEEKLPREQTLQSAKSSEPINIEQQQESSSEKSHVEEQEQSIDQESPFISQREVKEATNLSDYNLTETKKVSKHISE